MSQDFEPVRDNQDNAIYEGGAEPGVIPIYHYRVTIVPEPSNEGSPKRLGIAYYSPVPVISTQPIAAYVSSVLNKWPTVEEALTAGWSSATPLDLTIATPCFVLFQLDPYWDWQFGSSGPAVTMKKKVDTRYRNLRHIDKDGKWIIGFPEQDDKCRLVYFFSNSAGDSTVCHDGCNIYICLNQSSGRVLEIRIDPDIKNNGGGPLPPPVG